MPLPDSTGRQRAPILAKTISLASVFICYALIEWVSSAHLLTRMVPHPPSLSISLAWLFEHHLWQFGIGMLVITVLSRGHLWSYGINSSDIRLSMSILLKFYMVASIFVAVVIVAPMAFSGTMPEYLAHPSRADMLAWILFQWMAAAVADNILYFGLFQTILLKYWQGKISIKPFEVPVAILMTTVLFAAGRTNVSIYGNHLIEFLLALAIGAYSGLVYFRTRSLLTPMLSQAFFYGLPFVARFIYLAAVGR
jgi:membrane protease YdiL (CAAX protease family)